MFKIPPARQVLQGNPDNPEIWTTFDPFKKGLKIEQQPQPIIVHPVQIKDLLRNQKCPIVIRAYVWFQLTPTEIIDNNLAIGRFFQAAYN